jgi:hypothetical protein
MARSALAALDADPDLKNLNLIVSVVDRVAVIGGPVPTPRHSRRAEEIVRSVEGIAEVRNNCFVALGPDPLLRAVAERMGSSLPPRPTMYQIPGVLTNYFTPDSADPRPTNPGNAVAAAAPRATVVVRKPAGEAGLLGAPVPPAGAGQVAAPVPHNSPAILTGNADRVLSAANELKKQEPRFSNLTVELRGSILVIGGTAPAASDAWDFAKLAQSIPGVSRIAVAAVAGK